MEKIIIIKERVLLFAEKQAINKQIFFEKTGLKYDNFKGKSKSGALGSDSIVNIFTTYPQINLEWLITGKGNMLKSEGNVYKVEEPQEKYRTNNEVIMELLKQNKEINEKYCECRVELANMKNGGKIVAENV